jgi:hypothetical protein
MFLGQAIDVLGPLHVKEGFRERICPHRELLTSAQREGLLAFPRRKPTSPKPSGLKKSLFRSRAKPSMKGAALPKSAKR